MVEDDDGEGDQMERDRCRKHAIATEPSAGAWRFRGLESQEHVSTLLRLMDVPEGERLPKVMMHRLLGSGRRGPARLIHEVSAPLRARLLFSHIADYRQLEHLALVSFENQNQPDN